MSTTLTYEAGTSFNPLNNAAFAMAGRGRSAVHLGRMVCPTFHRQSYLVSTFWPGAKCKALTIRAFAEGACFCRVWAKQMSSAAWLGLCFSRVGVQAAQAAGGALGTAVALRWVPHDWQGRFRTFDQGPKPGVSLALGAACECILSFAINLVVLWSAHTRWAGIHDLSSCAALGACMHAVCGVPAHGPAKQLCLLSGTGIGKGCNTVGRLHAVERMPASWIGHGRGSGPGVPALRKHRALLLPICHAQNRAYRPHAEQAQAPGLCCAASCYRAPGAPACHAMRAHLRQDCVSGSSRQLRAAH